MRIRTSFLAVAAAAALAVGLVACSPAASTTSGSDGSGSSSSTSSSNQTSAPANALSGTFAGLNGKNVAGTVKIDGSTVTLAGFSSDEGPDLHIYLTTGTTEEAVSAGVQIATVAFDKDAQTFTLPAGTDASSFTDVVIHCDKAKAVFGAAPVS